MKTDFRDRSHLSVIDGEVPDDQPKKRYRRKRLGQSEQIVCYQCEKDTGVATSATTPMTLSPRRTPEGKKTGGTKAEVCVYCLSRGKVTVLIR